MTERTHRIDIELSEAEYHDLTFLCGYALATALKQGDTKHAQSFLHIANRLHENDPRWTPYDETYKDKP